MFLFSVQLQATTQPAVVCKRHLSLHEHLSMGILSKYGVTIPRGDIAITPEQARDVAEKFGKRILRISAYYIVCESATWSFVESIRTNSFMIQTTPTLDFFSIVVPNVIILCYAALLTTVGEPG